PGVACGLVRRVAALPVHGPFRRWADAGPPVRGCRWWRTNRAAAHLEGEPQPVVQPGISGYGLLAVCSASKVNVAAELTPCMTLPVDSGRLTRRQSTSLVPAARFRSPAWAPWAELPTAAPLSVV